MLCPQLSNPPINVFRIEFGPATEASATEHLHSHGVVQSVEGWQRLKAVGTGFAKATDVTSCIPANGKLRLGIDKGVCDRPLDLWGRQAFTSWVSLGRLLPSFPLSIAFATGGLLCSASCVVEC